MNDYEFYLQETSDYNDWINNQILDEITPMLNDSIIELRRNLKTIDYTDCLVIILNKVESLIIQINSGNDDEGNCIQELIRQFVLFHFRRIKMDDKLKNFASEIKKTEELILNYVDCNSWYFSYAEIEFNL